MFRYQVTSRFLKDFYISLSPSPFVANSLIRIRKSPIPLAVSSHHVLRNICVLPKKIFSRKLQHLICWILQFSSSILVLRREIWKRDWLATVVCLSTSLWLINCEQIEKFYRKPKKNHLTLKLSMIISLKLSYFSGEFPVVELTVDKCLSWD